MKICIYGAGAVGAFLGTQLQLAGQDVSMVARGANLEAMQWDGVTLRIAGEERIANPRCTSNPEELGEQDVVFITVKAYQVADIVEPMQPLLGPDTAVVWAVNGVPWWYFYGLEGPWADTRIACVDPDDVLWDRIGVERIVGCVVYPAVELVEPGVVQHFDGRRFSLGEPGGSKSDRVQQIAAALIDAGFRAPIRDIRNEIWLKLLGNLAFNPVSALTGATLDVVATDTGTREVCRRMMLEGRAIGEALGVRFSVDVEQRLDGGAAVGPHRTSMLQDLLRHQPLELDALVTAVQELGRLVELPTPTIDVVLALIRQRVNQKI